MDRKKRLLTVLVVVLACAAGFLILRASHIPHPGDNLEGNGTDPTVPGPISVHEPVLSGSINPGQYRNGGIYTWTAPGGGTFSVGLESDGDQDHIYLNIRYSEAEKDGNSIGYYLKSERGMLEFSDWDEILTDCDSGENVNHANFYIPRQLYSQVAIMEYVDARRYGVRWSDDGADGDIAGTTVTVRAVNLNTAEFIGVFDISIDYDEESKIYAVQTVKGADVKETGLLSEEERMEAVEAAINFASETVLTEDLYAVPDWKDVARGGAFVHKTSRAYFGRLLNTEKKADKFTNYYTCKDTVAVTLPISLYGYLTVYLAPQTECIGLTEPTLYDSDDLDLQVYGYDPLNPRDEETVVVPVDFYSY